MELGKISVGAPYFALLFSLLLIPLIFAMPLGVFSRFKRDDMKRILGELRWPMAIGVLAGLVTAWLDPGRRHPCLAGYRRRGLAVCRQPGLAHHAACAAVARQRGFTRAETAMTLAHIGVAIFLVGISLTNATSTEKHLRMAPGDRFASWMPTNLPLPAFAAVQGPNYVADEGEFIVTKGGKEVARMYPQKRRYGRADQIMTEAAIDPGLTRDLYVSLGEPLEGGQAWAVRLYHKPFRALDLAGRAVHDRGRAVCRGRPALSQGQPGADRQADATCSVRRPYEQTASPAGVSGARRLLAFGLHNAATKGDVPSPLIGKPVPAFDLPALYDPEEYLHPGLVCRPALPAQFLGQLVRHLPRMSTR